jgi:hypothetical protein
VGRRFGAVAVCLVSFAVSGRAVRAQSPPIVCHSLYLVDGIVTQTTQETRDRRTGQIPRHSFGPVAIVRGDSGRGLEIEALDLGA